jgi:hypothetical protein
MRKFRHQVPAAELLGLMDNDDADDDNTEAFMLVLLLP